MTKYLCIDPGNHKCGLILADLEEKKIYDAIIIESNLLVPKIKYFMNQESISKIVIGNGTNSKEHINKLDFLGKDLIIAEEKNTTLRAKKRYFEIFPLKGLKKFLPKEIFVLDLNLDAIAALIILEDYLNQKFDFNFLPEFKTWKKL